MRSRIALVTLALLSAALPLRACLHVPRDYKLTVHETSKEAIIYHDGTNAHLIIRTGLEAPGELPKTLAWVLPLPALPVRYQEEGEDLFKQLYQVFVPRYKGKLKRSMAQGGAGDGIKVYAALHVGSYEIHPIEILSDDAGGVLNDWLSSNGFGTMPVKYQKYYLHKGAAFLALKLSGLKGSVADIKPLHIVYPADRASMPLKFSFHEFDLKLYTITPKRLQPDVFAPYKLQYKGNHDLTAVHGRLPDLFKALGPISGYVTEFEGVGYNSRSVPFMSVEALPGDPFILAPKP